jgi:hypothetical protein
MFVTTGRSFRFIKKGMLLWRFDAIPFYKKPLKRFEPFHAAHETTLIWTYLVFQKIGYRKYPAIFEQFKLLVMSFRQDKLCVTITEKGSFKYRKA